MQVKIVDASALGALIFGEPESDSIAEVLSGAVLIAPTLIWYELSSICLKKLRRHPDLASEIRAAFRMAGRLKLDAVDVDQQAVLTLAENYHLTTYDASYLWLAIETGGQLVTLDKRLKAAADSVTV